jgi:hypothetical protein
MIMGITRIINRYGTKKKSSSETRHFPGRKIKEEKGFKSFVENLT